MKYIVFGDIHEDLESFKLLLEKVDHRDFNKAKKVCLGDVIGRSKKYHVNGKQNKANECLDKLRENNIEFVIGNHDLYHIRKLPEHQIFKFPKDWYSLNISERIKKKDFTWVYEDEFELELFSHNSNYLKKAEEYKVINNILFSHFLFPDFTGASKLSNSLFRSILPAHFNFLKQNNCSFSFIGHLHPERTFLISSKGKRIELKVGEEFTFDNKQVYIICCAPLSSTKGSYLIFDDFKMTLTINLIK